MLRTSLSMPEKGNIFISKQKHSFSQGAFVCKHEDLSEHFEVVCNQKDGLRWVIFSPENVGQLFPITIYLQNLSTSTLKSNRIIVRRTMAQNKWRRMMQVEGMLDKIGIVHWMSLSNTPILWITLLYLTNCTILPQEICFRGSQCYKCSLLVRGWRHNVSLTSQMQWFWRRKCHMGHCPHVMQKQWDKFERYGTFSRIILLLKKCIGHILVITQIFDRIYSCYNPNIWQSVRPTNYHNIHKKNFSFFL